MTTSRQALEAQGNHALGMAGAAFSSLTPNAPGQGCAAALFSTDSGKLVFADRAWIELAAQTGCAPGALADVFPSLDWTALLATAGTGAPSVRHGVVAATLRPGATPTWWNLELRPDHAAASGEAPLVLVRATETTRAVLDAREAEAVAEALADTNARLGLAQEAAGIGTWEWHLATDRVAWSPDQFRLHGMDPAKDVPPSFDQWLGMVHPDDQPRLADALKTGFRSAGDGCGIEFRLHRVDTGEERLLLVLAQVMESDPSGQPLRMLGVNLDVTDRRRADAARQEAIAALGRSEARFRGIFDSTFQFIGLLSPDGTLIEANRTALDFGGLDLAEIAGRPFWTARWWAEAPDPATPARLRDAVARAASGEFVRYEVEVRGAGDRTAVIDFSLRPVHDAASGAVVFIVPEGRDVTAWRAEAAAHRAAEERLRLAQEVACLGVWEYDPGSRLFWLSPDHLAIHGLPPEASGTLDLDGWLAMVHPDDRDRMRAATLAMERTGQLDEEFRIRRADTFELRWIHSKAGIVQRPSGPVLLGVLHDVTARKLATEATRERDQRIRLAFAAAGIFAWDWDVTSGRVEWSGAGDAALGLPAGGFPGTVEAFRDLVHPEDRPAVEAALRRALTGEDPEYAATFRMRRGDGSWRHTATRGSVVVDANGLPIRVFGVDHDISARVEAEAALAEARRRLEEALDAGGIAVWAMDVAQGTAEWDARMCALFGLPAERARLTWEEWAARIHPEDLAAVEAAYAAGLVERRRFCLEHRLHPEVAGDAERWIKVVGAAEHDPVTGAPLRTRGVATDVTDRKAAELSASAALQELEIVYADVSLGLCVIDADMRWTRINARLAEINGYPVEAHLGRSFRELLPDIADAAEALHRRVFETGEPVFGIEITGETPVRPGVLRSWEVDWLPLRDPRSGRVTAVNVVVREVTEERALREALSASETRYRATFEQAAVGVAHVGLDGRWLRVNARLCEMLGYAEAELLAAGVAQATDLPDPDANHHRRLLAEGGESFRLEKRYIRKDGTAFWADVTVSLLRDAAGAPFQFVSVVQDISERKAAEERQVCRLALLEALRDLPGPEAKVDATTALLGRHLGVAQVGLAEVLPGSGHILVSRDWNDDRIPSVAGTWRMDDFGPAFVREMKAGTTIAIPDVGRDPRTSTPEVLAAYDGIRTRAILYVPLVREERQVAMLFIHHPEPRAWTADEVALVEETCARLWDAAERARAEEALAESEARFRILADAMPQMIWSALPDGHHEYYNAQWYAFTGVPAGSTDGEAWNGVLHPDDQARAWARWRHSLETGEPYDIEYRLRRHDGVYRWTLGRALPMRDAEGSIIRWFGTCNEIHDQKEAADLLLRGQQELEILVAERTRALAEAARELQAEMRRREDAQAALLQAQKLDALGHLTSSVAHDFNNLLAAVQGSYRLLRRETDGNARAMEIITHGEHAAERGALLIAELTSFARKEEPRPAVVRLAELLPRTQDLLRHTAGAAVRCSVVVEPDTWPVLTDPVRLETTLLNLAANARDAMPLGGDFHILVRNASREEVPPGLPDGRDFVRIAARDTGEGMDAATLRHATEPFFTTKPRGMGTGLGLASAQAFCTASDGMLRIRSAPGEGTEIELFLPQAAVLPSGAAELSEHSAWHGDATIMLVDDDAALRPMTAGLLRSLGYTVIDAPGTEAALTLAHAHDTGRIDMLVTDIVMAGLPGTALAARLRASHPALPVLYVTGHRNAVALAGAMVLNKPFTEADLVRMVLRGLGRLPAEVVAPQPADRLRGRLHRAPLRGALDRWIAARDRAAGALPPPALMEGDDLPPEIADHAYLAEIRPTPDAARIGAAGFRFLRAGRVLEERFGAPLVGLIVGVEATDSVAMTDLLGGSLGAAYGRCARTCAPLYDYARFDLGDAPPVLMERLVLPVSADGVWVTHLFGVATVTNERGMG